MLEALENHRILIVEDSAIHRSEIMRVQLNRLESSLKSRHMEVLRAYSCMKRSQYYTECLLCQILWL